MHIFKCHLCHRDYSYKSYTTTDVTLYFKHLRDIHKTTDFNLDRFLHLGYQLKGMNEEHIQIIYRIIEISLMLKHVKEYYYTPKAVTLKEVQEAVKRIMMD